MNTFSSIFTQKKNIEQKFFLYYHTFSHHLQKMPHFVVKFIRLSVCLAACLVLSGFVRQTIHVSNTQYRIIDLSWRSIISYKRNRTHAVLISVRGLRFDFQMRAATQRGAMRVKPKAYLQASIGNYFNDILRQGWNNVNEVLIH